MDRDTAREGIRRSLDPIPGGSPGPRAPILATREPNSDLPRRRTSETVPPRARLAPARALVRGGPLRPHGAPPPRGSPGVAPVSAATTLSRLP